MMKRGGIGSRTGGDERSQDERRTHLFSPSTE